VPRVVVLGTGTAVGKTYVTCALARALHARLPNAPIVCVKPIETGVRRGLAQPISFATAAHVVDAAPNESARATAQDATAQDAAALEAVCFNAQPPKPHPLFALEVPVSPYRAARLAGREVDLTRIPAWLLQINVTLHDTTWLLIETAGGVYSPLARGMTNLDLAVMLEPALWLLVAPDTLGVLHDLSATLQAMRGCARAPDLVVLSAARAADESTGGNLEEAIELGIAEPVAALARDDAGAIEVVVDAVLAMGWSTAAPQPT
jgi:dethiobiotin synthetase